MHLVLALTELYLVNCLYIFLLFIVNINLHEGNDVHPHGMSHRRPNQSDAPRITSDRVPRPSRVAARFAHSITSTPRVMACPQDHQMKATCAVFFTGCHDELGSPTLIYLNRSPQPKSPEPHARGLFFPWLVSLSPHPAVHNQALDDPQALAYAEAETWAEA
jgi:hypothetical protein